MNGSTAKLLRQVATTIGRDPKYIKKYYKSMTPQQQLLYRTYVTKSLLQVSQRKEELNGKNLPTVPKADSAAGE